MLCKGFPSFLILKKELYGPLHEYQSQKPTALASLVLHKGLHEAKIPPHHRLSLHQLLHYHCLFFPDHHGIR